MPPERPPGRAPAAPSPTPPDRPDATAPPTLAAAQTLLGRVLRAPGPPAGDEAAAVARLVRPSATLSALARAEIYREQFWCRHLESLSEDLPALARLLGEASFDRFLRAYLSACPPRSFTLRDLGDRLVAFADGYASFPTDRAEAARELVRFEMALFHAFDAADDPPIDALPEVSPARWAEARLSFLRTLSIATYAHPVGALRASVKRGAIAPGEPVTLPRRRTHVALWRDPFRLEVKHRTLGDGEHTLIEALRGGASIGEACLAARDHAAQVGRWFRGFTARGWITAVTLPAT